MENSPSEVAHAPIQSQRFVQGVVANPEARKKKVTPLSATHFGIFKHPYTKGQDKQKDKG